MSRLLHLANAQPLDPSGVTASFLRGSCKEIKPQSSLPEPGRSYLLLGFLNWFARFPEQDKKTKWPRHVTHIKVPLLRLSPTTALSSVHSIKAGVQIIKSLTNKLLQEAMEGSWLPTLSAPYSPQWHRGNGTVHGAERTSSLRIQYLRLLRPVLIHGQGWGHASGMVSWNGFYRQPSGSDGEEVIHSIPNIENELLRILLSQLRALIHFWKKIKKKKSPTQNTATWLF